MREQKIVQVSLPGNLERIFKLEWAIEELSVCAEELSVKLRKRVFFRGFKVNSNFLQLSQDQLKKLRLLTSVKGLSLGNARGTRPLFNKIRLRRYFVPEVRFRSSPLGEGEIQQHLANTGSPLSLP